MSNVTTIKGSLFDAPKGSIIVHACNTKGVWGSGIAAVFAKRFPVARNIYATHCQRYGSKLIGTCFLIDAGDYTIGCLFTSKNFGGRVDTPEKILKATRLAIADLIYQNGNGLNKPIHMCKINSGLFRVPWKDTKAILKDAKSTEFTVYDY